MATVYLDVDDEITSAAARLRTAEDLRIAIVLPAGSRIATSRINFRLLAHEAARRSRRLAIVAPEASARALAASAGLPVFATVVEYEEAFAEDAPGEAPRSPGSSPTSGAAALAAAGPEHGGREAPAPGEPTPVPVDKAAPPAERPSPAVPAEPLRPRAALGPSTGLGAGAPSYAPRRRRRWPLAVAIVLVAAILGGAGAAVGYVVLPSATVSLRLTAVPLDPVSFVATGDPDAVAVDPATATIPAVRIALPLSASGTFKASGKRVESSAATGQVRWTSCDPTRSYTIARGTLARTPGGVAFATQEAIFLPVAILDPPRITCQDRLVDVVAVQEGPAGNVAAGTVTVVPGALNDVVIKVTNPAAMAGGARTEHPRVVAKDVSAAVAALTGQLDAQLAAAAAAAAASPPGLPPAAVVYPATARRGLPTPSEAAADIVGREEATFDLTLVAGGTVVACDPSPLAAIAEQRIAARLGEGMALREGSTQVTVGPGDVAGEAILLAVSVRAEAVRDVTPEAVRALVKGLTEAEAVKALAPYGRAEVVLWPGWAGSVTTLDARLDVTVEGVPPASASPAPATPAPPPTQSPAATAGRSAGPSPTPAPSP